MKATEIWLARLVPLAVIAAHLGGTFLWSIDPGAPLGLPLIFGSWVVLTIYTLIMWALGDFIQQALNMKPWSRRDEFQKDAARRALTVTYFTVLFAVAMLAGANLDTFMLGDDVTIEEKAATGRVTFAILLFIGVIGAALPTLVLGWILKPVRAEEFDGEDS